MELDRDEIAAVVRKLGQTLIEQYGDADARAVMVASMEFLAGQIAAYAAVDEKNSGEELINETLVYLRRSIDTKIGHLIKTGIADAAMRSH